MEYIAKLALFVISLVLIPGALGQIKTHRIQQTSPTNNETINYWESNSTSTSLYPVINNQYGFITNLTANRNNDTSIYRNTKSQSSTFNFINKTLTDIASGICHKEVPTITLLRDPRGQIPAGNGSDPSLSRIQVCCDGYERNVHNFRKCDPICRNECINGICVAPDECSCYPDYVRNLAGFCIATCPIGCGNGDCAPDRSCVCKPGFTLDVSRKYCNPVCSQGCNNGNCTAPDTCVCKTGFELNLSGQCVPKCTGGCAFGRCVAPDVCSCNTGYIKVGQTCEPTCTKGCLHGKCSAPETCSCNIGWTLDISNSICVPKCDQGCMNGVCTGPNICTCNRGFILDENFPNRCQPHCPSGCPNGVCTAPNFCICQPGFIKDRSIKGNKGPCVPY